MLLARILAADYDVDNRSVSNTHCLLFNYMFPVYASTSLITVVLELSRYLNPITPSFVSTNLLQDRTEMLIDSKK